MLLDNMFFNGKPNFRKIEYDFVKKHLNKLNETYSFDKEINESLGSFNYQQKLAMDIASIMYKMMINREEKNYYKINNNFFHGIISQIILKIDGTINMALSANIYSLDVDKHEVVIHLLYPNYYVKNDKEIVIKAFSSVISHELMHLNITIERYLKGVDPENRPKYYDNAINALRDLHQTDFNSLKYKNEIYFFFRTIYLSYFQEIQAIISQTATQIMISLIRNNKKNYTTKEKIQIIKNTEAYQIFLANIHAINKLIKMDSKIFNEYVLGFAKEYNINMTVVEAKRFLIMSRDKFIKAIPNIFRNAMLEFDKHENR